MAESSIATYAVSLKPAELPLNVHRWNLWVSGTEAAIYIAAADMMGPMTLIPFLFNRTGIDNSWLGLFTISALLLALGGPVGTAIAGGRERKLSFCIKVGILQRLPFFLVPIGATFFFSSPYVLLVLFVLAWAASNFVGGICAPLYQVVITNGTRESSWGMLMSLRYVLAATGGLITTGFVWWANRTFILPHNYIVIGWAGVAMLFVSLYIVSQLHEVPTAQVSGRSEPLSETVRQMGRILRDHASTRWLILGQFFRAFGFLLGTYMTAVLIERCHLTEEEMWIPLLLSTLPAIAAHMAAGWLVDHWGAKPALVLSSLLVAVNSFYATYCYSMPAFVVLFLSGMFGGSLMANAWPTLLTKQAPASGRPLYFSTVSLATAPGNVAVMLAGIYLVRVAGYNVVFDISAVGALISAVIFYAKLPHIRTAAQEWFE
ncbi:MAG: MFS transporter [Candidatus Hydrogenedentes bacterium]|nr:MFS transporter [Candidatus Hydrogenedentota bacterium]